MVGQYEILGAGALSIERDFKLLGAEFAQAISFASGGGAECPRDDE
jgi:hypothetical protein